MAHFKNSQIVVTYNALPTQRRQNAYQMNLHLLSRIALFCLATGIVASAFSSYQVREMVSDSETRRYLSVHGVFTVGTEVTTHCPHFKGSIEISFIDVRGSQNIECISRIGDDLPIDTGNVGDKLDVVYDPAIPSRVYLASGGNLPQRNVQGIWTRWIYQNFGVLLIVWSFVAVALWREEKKRRFDEQIEQ